MYFASSEDLTAYADENLLNTVIRNLVSNAIKFTNESGQIRINARKIGELIEVEVADNGMGMSNEVRDSLFSDNSSLSLPGTANELGSGLGLILCKQFVEKQGGRLWVESELGKGSSFKFTIPIAI